MPASLASLTLGVKADPGLRASIPDRQIALGADAADELNAVLLQMIAQTKVNADRRISAADMQAVSDALWLDANALPWRKFWLAHGNDNGDVVSGFHWVQNDGATLEFQGRNFVDTVADAIYHYGFRVEEGRYANEDGNANETILDVAGWLNFFLNGENIVYGTDATEDLGTGSYSTYFAAARNETFLAGAGNDRIWSGDGNDKIHGGTGNDQSGGGTGRDLMLGEAGNDTLLGESGNDSLQGGTGRDVLGGGTENDQLDGGSGDDMLSGEQGNDRLIGGEDADTLHGGDGADRLEGGNGVDQLYGGAQADVLLAGSGNDRLHGGEGADRLFGGAGADTFQLWETDQAVDTIYLIAGDSGRAAGTIDRVEGFTSGVDKIDLSTLGPMGFTTLDFRGGGRASCFYDGDYLRIDSNGDGVSDMIVNFAWVNSLSAGDFIFA